MTDRDEKRGGSDIEIDILFGLLKDQATIDQVNEFLRSRGLAFSSQNWADLIERRLKRYHRDGAVPRSDILRLLADAEEHGRQHVFLYESRSGRSVAELFDEPMIAQRIAASPMFPPLGQPSIVDQPDVPTVVEVRYDRRDGERCLVVKIVEKRFLTINQRVEQSGGTQTITSDLRPYRAVNVVRVRESGLAEVRIYSHRDAIDYWGIVTAMWKLISTLVPADLFTAVSLDNMRNLLWDKDHRDHILRHFAVRNSDHRNAAGNRVRAAASAVGSTMFDDAELVASVDRFHSELSQAYCERAAVSLKSDASDGKLRRDVNLLFQGKINEFTITQKLGRDEFEYVLDQILDINWKN